MPNRPCHFATFRYLCSDTTAKTLKSRTINSFATLFTSLQPSSSGTHSSTLLYHLLFLLCSASRLLVSSSSSSSSPSSSPSLRRRCRGRFVIALAADHTGGCFWRIPCFTPTRDMLPRRRSLADMQAPPGVLGLDVAVPSQPLADIRHLDCQDLW